MENLVENVEMEKYLGLHLISTRILVSKSKQQFRYITNSKQGRFMVRMLEHLIGADQIGC